MSNITLNVHLDSQVKIEMNKSDHFSWLIVSWYNRDDKKTGEMTFFLRTPEQALALKAALEMSNTATAHGEPDQGETEVPGAIADDEIPF